MTVPKRLEQAASQLEEAYWRVDLARKKPASLESLTEWLEALTDAARALADIQQANNESVHEKLHQLAGRVGVSEFSGPASKTRSVRRSLPRGAARGRR